MAETAALNGAQRAAVLLMSLGESEAASVLRHMDPREVQKIGVAMASIAGVTREQAENVMDQFVDVIDTQTSIGVGADDWVRKVLVSALGSERADGMVDRILRGNSQRGLESLRWMEPRAVADMVKDEHPQTVAIVVAHLEPESAAAVVELLPERTRSEVLIRVATLEQVPPSALAELDQIMKRHAAKHRGGAAAEVGGVKRAAAILNHLDSASEQAILATVRGVDGGLGERIEEQMFVFDDLVRFDDRAMQTILRDVSGEKLGVALRGADPRVRDKIFKNMSQRAAQILQDDMETRGPAKLADVESAQREILAQVRKLAEAGTIQIPGRGGALI